MPDKFRKTTSGTRPLPAYLTATKAIGAASITTSTTSGWPTDTQVDLVIYRKDSNNNQVAGTVTTWVGTVTGAGSVGSLTLKAGTDQEYASGEQSVVVMTPTAAWSTDLVAGLLTEHTQAGGHKNITTDTITTTGNVTIGGSLTIGGSSSSGGWSPITGAISAVTYNGQRSYDLTTAADNTGNITPGMRLRTTRTVSAPTQSTSLNGTTQYYSKTTPAGMTFTDDFVVSAWIKLTSYQDASIASRFNGTSGWGLRLNSYGQVQILGWNGGASNASYAQSLQSVPLNRWVHVAAQLDMSSFTATSSTSYVMIDGVDVPTQVFRGGTNPTALVQAGDLQIGRENTLYYFPGKIAQVAIYSAKVSQANIRATMSQGLVGNETSLVSAYSFNNSITDLNTTNANNLTANGSAVATNADSPFGGQGDGTISATLDYGIVTKITSTTITVQVPEGCMIPSTGGVSACSYSGDRLPYGFPGQAAKWQILMITNSRATKGTPTSASTYNTGDQITIPVGQWVAGYRATIYVSNSVSATLAIYTDLDPTAVTSPWPAAATLDKKSRFAAATYVNSVVEIGPSHSVRSPLSLSSTTQYWFTYQPTTSGGTLQQVGPLSDFSPTILFAENAYL